MTDSLTIWGTDYTGVKGFKADDGNDNTLAYIRPQGTKSITQNGTGIDVAEYAAVDVSVSGGGSPTLQTKAKNYTPTESQQTEAVIADSGYDGLDTVNVTVGAISSSYVGSGITRRSSSDLTASGNTVSAPAGYYESSASKAVASGSASTPATTITVNPTISVSSGGLITATASASQNVTPTVSAGYVSSGTAGTVSVSGSNTSQLTTQAAQTIHPSMSDQTIASGKYLTGAQTIKAVTLANLTADNIKFGVTVTIGDSSDPDCVASVTGTYTGGGSSKNIQVYAGYATRKANSYGATDVQLTVAKTGTYTITWIAWRSSSSGTMGTNLHIGSTAEATNHQTFTGTYGQCITLTGQSLTQGTVLTVYATSGSTSRSIYVGNLIIEEE